MMTSLIRALAGLAICLLAKAEEPIRPVTVCDVLADPAQFSGRNIAVVGKEHVENFAVWVTANDCSLRVQPYFASGFQADLLDRLALAEKLKQARAAAPPDEKRVWSLFYGRVETREDFERDHWVGSFAAPVQLLFKGSNWLSFNDEGVPVVTVSVGGGPIFISPQGALTVTLCELLKTPTHYRGKLIQLSSALAPSGANTLPVLSDQGCSTPVQFEGPGALLNYEYGLPPFQSLAWCLKQGRVVEATFWGTVKQVHIPHSKGYLDFGLQSYKAEILR
jgi:hypothetical protein